MNRRPSPLLSVLLAGLAAAGCTRQIVPDRGPTAYYQTAYPVHDTAGDLERVMEAVRRIEVTSVYETYHFLENDAPTGDEALDDSVLSRAEASTSTVQTRSATAVVVSRSGRDILMLTASHAVHLPDTVVQYFDRGRTEDRIQAQDRRIRNVSILRRRSNWVMGLPAMNPFQVLVEDRQQDLAFLGTRSTETEDPRETPVFPLRAGDSDRLSWGSFVYTLGHPSGYPMVTRGVVSSPGGELPGGFAIDGSWNEGMSGGPVLSVRGETGAMEWIGMARASAVSTEHRLAPPEAATEDHDPWRPYEGPLFIQEIRRIQYGIMLAVPINAVRDFMEEHRQELRALGYDPPDL